MPKLETHQVEADLNGKLPDTRALSSSAQKMRGRRGAGFLCGLALALSAGAGAQAQGLITTAQISGTLVAPGQYDYTLTLNNSPSSTVYVQTFWFAWQAGQADFMASQPTSVTPAAGWTATVIGSGDVGDGYSIKFVSSTAPLAPGSSISFNFVSPDSPTVMRGPSPAYPQFPVLSSDVYSGFTSGIREDIIAQMVPEPSTYGLLATGAMLLGLGGRWTNLRCKRGPRARFNNLVSGAKPKISVP